MPMSTLEKDTLAKAFAVCKTLLLDIQPKLAGLAQIYDSVGGVKETLTQAELDELAELSGLTKAQVDDGLYVLTTTLFPALVNGYPALAQLAARFL
jgi:hypothetical protein